MAKLSGQAKRMKACKGKKGDSFKRCAGLLGDGGVGVSGLEEFSLEGHTVYCNPTTGKCRRPSSRTTKVPACIEYKVNAKGKRVCAKRGTKKEGPFMTMGYKKSSSAKTAKGKAHQAKFAKSGRACAKKNKPGTSAFGTCMKKAMKAKGKGEAEE